MSFFTDGPRERPLFPVRERELFGYEGRPWMGPPNDHIVPALLPWARPLGRSERTIVALRGIEVWPSALTLRLAVYSRDSLEEGRSGSLIDHRRVPDYNALLVGVLYPDGSRASSESISVPSASEPTSPVLRAVGGGGTQFHLDHQIFVWPLPGDGPFTLVVQWLDRDIKETHTELDGAAIRAAAEEAGELWPGLPKRPGNGVALRNAVAVTDSGVSAGPSAARTDSALAQRTDPGSEAGHEIEDSGAAEPVTAPGELRPERSPSVLLPRLADGGSLLPRRNVALGPERPVPRPPGTATPLPRRTPTSRSGNAPLPEPPAGLADLLAGPVPPEPPAEPAGSPPDTTDSPTVALPVPGAAEPAPRPERTGDTGDTGDSPTVALPAPAAAGPEPQAAEPPRPPAPLPQPSRRLPQPSRSAKDAPPKPGRGGRAWRWRDPGE